MMSSPPRQRPTSAVSLPKSTVPDATPAARKYPRPDFRFVFPFDLPPTPEELAVRISKNLAHFGLFYALVLWVGLSISLVPQRQPSLFILLLMTLVTNSFLIVLRLTPHTVFMHGAADKAVVLFALGVVTAVALILTGSAIHMLVTFAIGIPVVLVHAIFWRDDLRYESSNSYGEEGLAGEVFVPLVEADGAEV